MSLLNTRTLAMREKTNLDKWETRPSNYGALDLFIRDSNTAGGIITPALEAKAMNAIGSVLETPVIDYDAGVTIGSSRSLTISDDENVSQMVTITFATLAWGFTQVPVLFNNNEVDAVADFTAKYQKYLYKVAETMDTSSLAALSAAKSQVLNDGLGLYTLSAGNVAVGALATQDEIIGDLNPMMSANDFFAPNLNIIGNYTVDSVVRKLYEHREYNDQDKTIQLADKNLGFTSRLANAGGHKMTGYACVPGSVGVLTQLERECMIGGSTATHQFGQDVLPMIGLPVGTYYYQSVGDYSAIAGAASADMDRVIKDHFGFSLNIAYLTAYNSAAATIESPILKFAVATS